MPTSSRFKMSQERLEALRMSFITWRPCGKKRLRNS